MSIYNRIQNGFSALILAVVIVVIALVGALGYVAYDKFIATDKVTEQSAVADDMDSVTTTEPAKVVDSADLDEAISTLDQITDSETSADVNLIDEQVSEF
jgi:hypothetical protein